MTNMGRGGGGGVEVVEWIMSHIFTTGCDVVLLSVAFMLIYVLQYMWYHCTYTSW